MLKNALIFATAAVIIGLSAPSFLPQSAAPVVASAPPAPAATDAAAEGRSAYREASIPADAVGQYHAKATIEGQEVEVMVDTGATMVALTAATAERLGVFVDPAAPKVRTRTANGDSLVSPVVLREVSLGSIEMNDVEAVVMPPGAGAANLLGAGFLKRLAGVEQRDGALALRQ
jgi:aspartyl protease family protein